MAAARAAAPDQTNPPQLAGAERRRRRGKSVGPDSSLSLFDEQASEAAETAPVVRVVVSHGAFIAAELFPHLSSAPEPDRSMHLRNTDMVFVRYLSDDTVAFRPQLLESPEPLPPLPALLESMRRTAVESLWPDSCALDTGARWRRCRSPRASPGGN